MGFSIIIPVYNEATVIRSVLIDMVESLNSFEQQYEIIVVNDCSVDKTREEIIASGIPVMLMDHLNNMGYGAALKTGIRNAQHECVVITDADGTYPNERIPELIKIFQKGNYDMVIGARIGKKVKIPLVRKPAKWFITKLANYLTGTKIPDLNSGLRVLKKEVIEEYMNILPDGFSFTSTITLAMLTNAYSLKYVPIDYFKRKGKSKIKPIQDTINFIQLIIRTVLYFNPLKVFVPLSMLLVLLAFVVIIVSWLLFGGVFDVLFGTILMSAVMVLAIGMLADLIVKKIR